MNLLHKIQIILNRNVITVLFFAITPFLFSQKKIGSTYKQEFKQVGKNEYSKQLIAASTTKINAKWNNYLGGAIRTDDSLFNFNANQLCFSFPTNYLTYTNSILIYYYAQKTAKCPTLFSLLNYYEPIIEENLKRNNLPPELKLLPAVLSAFNPYSDNGIGGTGYWHLNYPQAIKYGLTVTNLVDERKDFKKATKAATLYLKDLHKMYKDWELTLTAYSSGVVTINKLLKRHSAKTYEDIYSYLPKETKDLVQAFVAMNYVYGYDSYGAVVLNPIIETEPILIERQLKFEAINHVINTTSKNLHFLNPTLIQDIFPANFPAYLPKEKKDLFLKLKDSIYFYQDSMLLKPKVKEPEFITPKNGKSYQYTVRSGDVLGLIADKNKVKISQIQAWNNLSGTRINVGQKLTIYGKSKKASPKKLKVRGQKIKEKKKTTVKENQIPSVLSTYIVKSGDSLWGIAKKFSGVSAQNIMDFNKIDGNLTIGQRIKIPKY